MLSPAWTAKLATARESQPTKDFGLIPIPKWLRYNPMRPFCFSTLLNVSFGLASALMIANLYYCQPLLIQLAESFNVTYGEVSYIPSLVQVGYLVGLLLISPLGDLVRRRQLVLLLVLSSTALTTGLAVTRNLLVFEILSFLTGTATVTPQILMPLASDLATPDSMAYTLSIVFSGLTLGILIARVIAGVIGNFATWRAVYYLSTGLQSLVLIGAYLILPDYPAKNHDLTYSQILLSMAKYATMEPLVIQMVVVIITSSACFTSFWVTLTFFLGGPPYDYSTLVIGLFGLTGILGVIGGPFTGHIIDKLTPWHAILFATSGLVVCLAVLTVAGAMNIAAVIFVCVGLDFLRQSQQLSISAHFISLSGAARSRLNAVYNIQLFVGQVIGTCIGTKIFLQYGWRACSLLMMALFSFQMIIILLRGPHCPHKRWFGYEGGFMVHNNVVLENDDHEEREREDSNVEEESGEMPQTNPL